MGQVTEGVAVDIPKNSFEVVRVQPTVFKGDRYVDIRVWYDPVDGDERRPSKKGVMLKLGLLPKLIEALREIDAATQEDFEVQGEGGG